MSEVVDLMGGAPTTKENNNRQTIIDMGKESMERYPERRDPHEVCQSCA